MRCTSCEKLIENCVSALNGVHSIKVDFVEERAHVNYDPGITNIQTIKSEIEKIGYTCECEPGNECAENSENAAEKEEKKCSSYGCVKQGIVYGLVPHIGCIAFIVGSVLGVTVLTGLFKPLLWNPYFFHILFLLSFVFATISSVFYLRKNRLLSLKGAKRKWRYLSTMYGSTMGINLVLFMLIFPLLANISLSSPTGAVAGLSDGASTLSSLSLQVAIPCPGHAPLISQELKAIDGVSDIQFSFPNIFNVRYNSVKTSKQQILALEVFETYKATVLSESQSQQNSILGNSAPAGSGGGCCGGGGGCGSSGSRCGCGG